jgi:hypothetical protein
VNGGGGSKFGLSSETSLDDLDAALNETIAEAGRLDQSQPAMALALRLYALEIKLQTIV